MFSLMGLHDSIGPLLWLGIMVYTGHDPVCIKDLIILNLFGDYIH